VTWDTSEVVDHMKLLAEKGNKTTRKLFAAAHSSVHTPKRIVYHHLKNLLDIVF
jgi:hypothetical protein